MSYDLNAMREAVKQIDKNIETFENAIEQEQKTKRDYLKIIRDLEAKQDGDVNNRPKSIT